MHKRITLHCTDFRLTENLVFLCNHFDGYLCIIKTDKDIFRMYLGITLSSEGEYLRLYGCILLEHSVFDSYPFNEGTVKVYNPDVLGMPEMFEVNLDYSTGKLKVGDYRGEHLQKLLSGCFDILYVPRYKLFAVTLCSKLSAVLYPIVYKIKLPPVRSKGDSETSFTVPEDCVSDPIETESGSEN